MKKRIRNVKRTVWAHTLNFLGAAESLIFPECPPDPLRLPDAIHSLHILETFKSKPFYRDICLNTLRAYLQRRGWHTDSATPEGIYQAYLENPAAHIERLGNLCHRVEPVPVPIEDGGKKQTRRKRSPELAMSSQVAAFLEKEFPALFAREPLS
jgi:hypothetical protein